MSVVVGYAYGKKPTYMDAYIDRMYEAESEKIWERLNTPDQSAEKYYAAAESIKKAVELLGKVVEAVSQGASKAEGLPLENKLLYFANDFEDRAYDLKVMMEKAKAGKEA